MGEDWTIFSILQSNILKVQNYNKSGCATFQNSSEAFWPNQCYLSHTCLVAYNDQ